MGVQAIGSAAHIRANNPQLANIQIIEANFRRDADSPVNWLERSVAVKQINRKTQSLIDKFLFAAAEKRCAARIFCANTARRRHSTPVKRRVRSRGQVQENLLSQNRRPDGLVAF